MISKPKTMFDFEQSPAPVEFLGGARASNAGPPREGAGEKALVNHVFR